jgi:glycosyltransferase involved in cell wall biosynthesis
VKVVHVPYTFAPDAVGGTEIYVEELAHSLRAYGVESVIAAPSGTRVAESYRRNGLRVHRFACAALSKHMLRELYAEGDPSAAATFGQILDEERPDAVHLHAYTRAVSVLLVRAAKQRGLPAFFTYHTPTVSCQRGTLMLRGREACDGALAVQRCTSCMLEGRGVPVPAVALLSHLPLAFARALDRIGLSGGIWTALRMPELVRARHAAIRDLLREVDGIVALKEWVRALLVRNGVAPSKIMLSEHGLPDYARVTEPIVDVAEKTLRVAFLGRADPVKGPDTLVKALRSDPGLDAEVHLYGVMQSSGDRKYWAEIERMAADDRRIRFLPPVPHHQVIPLLRRYHLLAVPSRWLETGPLVLLEAFAAGTPVIGASLGGVAEWLHHEKNGLLVEPDNVSAWAHALRRCSDDRAFLSGLRRAISEPRRMSDVANDMFVLYGRSTPTV